MHLKCIDPNSDKPFNCKFEAGYTGVCSAFCAQIIDPDGGISDKCETIRNKPDITINACPSKTFAISGDCTKCAPFEGIDVLDKEYNKCNCPDKCPYTAESIKDECKPFSETGDEPPVVKNQELFDVTVPTTQCPGLKNWSEFGIPAFLTNLRLRGAYDPLNSVTCQNACACNDPNGGLAPPSCAYTNPDVYPGPVACCYCDGNHIAYDKESFDPWKVCVCIVLYELICLICSLGDLATSFDLHCLYLITLANHML